MVQYNVALLLENDSRIDIDEKENTWQLLLEVDNSEFFLLQKNLFLIPTFYFIYNQSVEVLSHQEYNNSNLFAQNYTTLTKVLNLSNIRHHLARIALKQGKLKKALEHLKSILTYETNSISVSNSKEIQDILI
jgi:hypothetical protein